MHEEQNPKEYVFEKIKIDDIKEDYLIEYKKTSSNIEGTRMQIIYYLEYFHDRGLNLKGKIIDLTYNKEYIIEFSEKTKKKLKNFIKNRVIVIPCGVDQSEFKGQPSKFPNPTIICISRLTKYKNLRILILAFAHLSTKLNARLIIVGSGPQKSELLSLTNGLKLKNRIKFLENLPRKDLASLIKSSHIFSLPSLVEGFGIATIESAAAGLPYVNSNIPIQREVTGNGKGGFLVDPQDPINFSNHFYKLMTDKNLYQKKSKEGLDLAKKYQWSKIADQTEVLYKSLYTKNAQLRKIG